MIDSNIEVIDLNPKTWCHLEAILDVVQPSRKQLFILFEKSILVRAVDSDNKLIEISKFACDCIEDAASVIFERFPQYQEVVVCELDAVKDYYHRLHSIDIAPMDTGQFMMRGIQCLEAAPGIETYCRSGEKGNFYERAQKILEKHPADCVIGIVICNKETIYFDCLLEIRNRRIVTLTTFERYFDDAYEADIDRSEQSLIQLMEDDFNLQGFAL